MQILRNGAPVNAGTKDALGTARMILMKFHKTEEACTQWLETPHRELDERRPIDVINEGRGEVVVSLLKAAYYGIPT